MCGRRVVALGLLFWLCCSVGASASDDSSPTLILLSWDGVRHDYPERLELPGLTRLAREGARAERLVPVFPTNTFPNHVSLATGAHPERHGIVDNRFHDRDRGDFDYSNDASWIEAEPLWIAAERQGVRAATFFWVGSETDWEGVAASYRVTPFDSTVGEAEKVDRILAWLDLPDGERPRLLMSWWHGADRAGHHKGPDHPDIEAALVEQDRELVRLLEALDARDAWHHTALLLVSDHGMTEVTERIDVERAVEAAGLAARVSSFSSVAHIFLDDLADLPRAAKVLTAVPGARVFRRENLPERLHFAHPTRTGDLVLLADPPSTFREPTFAQLAWIAVGRLFGWSSGLHGYDPEHPDMPGVFFAMGRGVPRGVQLGPMHAVDVAPTAAALLGIDPPRDAVGVSVFASPRTRVSGPTALGEAGAVPMGMP